MQILDTLAMIMAALLDAVLYVVAGYSILMGMIVVFLVGVFYVFLRNHK